MFIDYMNKGIFKRLDKQLNILALVGNGFDIAILKKLNKDSYTTSYMDFYSYITDNNIIKDDNLLYRIMKEDKDKNKTETVSSFV